MANDADEVNPYEAPKAKEKTGKRARRAQEDESMAEDLAAIQLSFEKTRPWITFFMVLTFIGVAVLVIGGIAAVATTASSRGSALGGIGPAGIILYWGLAAIYGIIAQRLMHYADSIRRVSRADGRLDTIADAVDKQQKFWSFVGGLTVAMLVLYAIIIVGFLALR